MTKKRNQCPLHRNLINFKIQRNSQFLIVSNDYLNFRVALLCHRGIKKEEGGVKKCLEDNCCACGRRGGKEKIEKQAASVALRRGLNGRAKVAHDTTRFSLENLP